MKIMSIQVGVMVVSLLISGACFADTVYFQNGFKYEGQVTEDAQAKGYWIDGALVKESEIKKIEKKEIDNMQEAGNEEKNWQEKLFSAASSLNAAFQLKMKDLYNKYKAAKSSSDLKAETANKTSNVSPSRTYTSAAQTIPRQTNKVYKGSASSVWKNVRLNTSTGAASGRYKNAGHITKRDRVNNSQQLKKNSAGYSLKNERLKNKSIISKQNNAGKTLSRQRAVTDRELSSLGSGSARNY